MTRSSGLREIPRRQTNQNSLPVRLCMLRQFSAGGDDLGTLRPQVVGHPSHNVCVPRVGRKMANPSLPNVRTSADPLVW